MKTRYRLEKGSALLQSVLLFAVGMLSIGLGMSFLPIIGILVGAAFMWFALYPWISVLHAGKVNVLVGSVTDNYLESRRFPVAILSATKSRDGFDFDPRRVDPATVSFGPRKARPLGNLSDAATYGRSLVDINEDGVPDLILYFSGDECGITESVEEVCVRARTWSGERILGCSVVDYNYETGWLGKLEYV